MLHPGSNLATDVVLSQGKHGPNGPTPWGGSSQLGQKAKKLTIATNQNGGRLGDRTQAAHTPNPTLATPDATRKRDDARGPDDRAESNQICNKTDTTFYLQRGKTGDQSRLNPSASNSMVEGEHAQSSDPAAAFAAVQDS
jgi:hypothetical protein